MYVLSGVGCVTQPLREYVSPQTKYYAESPVVCGGYILSIIHSLLAKYNVIIVVTWRWRGCLTLVSKGLTFILTQLLYIFREA